MSESRNCFTVTWKIKNFNFYSKSKKSGIHSPIIFAHVLHGTRWSLYLCTDDESDTGCIECYIRREGGDDYGYTSIHIDYELSLLANNGSALYSEMFLKKMYFTYNTDWKTALRVNKDEVFLHKKELFMSDETLTIRCRMWDSYRSISQSESCYIETSIKTHCKAFVGTVRKSSCLKPREERPVSITTSTGYFLSSMYLCAPADDEQLVIEMFVRDKFIHPFRYKIFIRDISGIKVKCGEGERECRDSTFHRFPLNLSKEHLIENIRFYFPNNILTIEGELVFSTGKNKLKHSDVEYGFDFKDTQDCASNKKETNLPLEYHSESFSTLKYDLNSSFEEGVLCDTELKTPTETFRVHIAVLGARSTFFKSMFTKKASKCVVIDDIDSDTVRRMLKFIYLDILDDLEGESAKSLYLAASKFGIDALKLGCSNALKQYILLKNCCDILSMADKHEDTDLKNAAQDYIRKNDKAVFSSDDWKNLEKNQPQLTIEVLRCVIIENQRK